MTRNPFAVSCSRPLRAFPPPVAAWRGAGTAPTPSTRPGHEYHLTGKGRALFPVIAALLAWGDQWAPGPGGPPVVLVHDACGNITVPVLACPHCHGGVTAANTHSQPGPGSRLTAAEARR
jgi:hypothetical protein